MRGLHNRILRVEHSDPRTAKMLERSIKFFWCNCLSSTEQVKMYQRTIMAGETWKDDLKCTAGPSLLPSCQNSKVEILSSWAAGEIRAGTVLFFAHSEEKKQKKKALKFRNRIPQTSNQKVTVRSVYMYFFLNHTQQIKSYSLKYNLWRGRRWWQ